MSTDDDEVIARFVERRRPWRVSVLTIAWSLAVAGFIAAFVILIWRARPARDVEIVIIFGIVAIIMSTFGLIALFALVTTVLEAVGRTVLSVTPRWLEEHVAIGPWRFGISASTAPESRTSR